MASRVIEIPSTKVEEIVAAAGDAGVEEFVIRAIDDRLGNLEFVKLSGWLQYLGAGHATRLHQRVATC